MGTDIVEIDRIHKLIDRFGKRFLDRVYTEEEQRYCESKKERFQHYAVRFAGKEAVLKALGTGLTEKMNWLDMGFVHDQYKNPHLVCSGEIDRMCSDRQIKKIHVSFSHSRWYAIATVICET
ncbi:holo-ACP synthase [candidate division KSB1 bacterium]|nr:holo-ACP synthase [candidate division KSB1 bacterium]